MVRGDNDRTHKDDAKYPISRYSQCWKSASCKQFRSLVLEPKTPFARSKTVILQENDLPLIMYWLFSSTGFSVRCCAYATYKCSLIDNCHPSKLKHQ